MENKFSIFAVDDSPVIQALMKSILQKEFDLEIFDSSEACLKGLDEKTPDLFLLDIGLPGVNGYSLCRRIREDARTRHTPVTFISSHDTEEDRLLGYDAGGDDFIIKPFNVDELLLKVKIAQRLLKEKATLWQKASELNQLASMVLSNMGEYEVLVRFFRKIATCTQSEEVAQAMLHCLQGYRLNGVVQIRISGAELTVSPEGKNRPLEVSVMSNFRSMERVFEFNKRTMFTFERIAVMVNSMPVEDAELYSRLRDHLTLALECADTKLDTIQASEAKLGKQERILEALGRIRGIIQMLEENQQAVRAKSSIIIHRHQEDLARTFISLGMTSNQEESIERLTKRGMMELVKLHESIADTQAMLSDLGQSLEELGR